LRDFVLSIHYLSGEGIGTGVALQRMHQVIILNMGTAFGATDIHTGRARQGAATGQVWVNGKQEVPFMLENDGVTAMYAITLRAGMLPYFIGLPAVETNDLAVGAEHWKRRGVFDLCSQLAAQQNIRQGFDMIEAYLLRHLAQVDLTTFDRVRWLGDALTVTPVEALCRQLGVTRKRLRSDAIFAFGGSVKSLQGILRFNDTLAAIARDSRRPLSSLHDYYDQSHFISDFKARAQLTPMQYRRLCARFPHIRYTPNFMAMDRETFLQFLAE
jgi:AraC-like DNA-binding protein